MNELLGCGRFPAGGNEAGYVLDLGCRQTREHIFEVSPRFNVPALAADDYRIDDRTAPARIRAGLVGRSCEMAVLT